MRESIVLVKCVDNAWHGMPEVGDIIGISDRDHKRLTMGRCNIRVVAEKYSGLEPSLCVELARKTGRYCRESLLSYVGDFSEFGLSDEALEYARELLKSNVTDPLFDTISEHVKGHDDIVRSAAEKMYLAGFNFRDINSARNRNFKQGLVRSVMRFEPAEIWVVSKAMDYKIDGAEEPEVKKAEPKNKKKPRAVNKKEEAPASKGEPREDSRTLMEMITG